jgi:tetratricopeptide (TPR) repeat protein
LEAQAQADLAARRFRKARDAFKLLCKQDRAKYLPALIEANRGLAEELMAKGQVAEAGQVIAYLKTITPPAELLGMDLLAAEQAQDWPRAVRLALDCWNAAQGTLAGRDRTLVADALVLAFPPLDAGSAVPEELRADLGGLLAALRALSEERFADAQDTLRPIPRGSLFADWKMLVKGWLAFHAGDRAKASQLLEAVPPDSAPGRAASALRPFLGPVVLADEQRQAGPIGRTCRLLGEPALGPLLARAEQLWRAGQAWESWQEMRRANAFPSELPNVYGALADFYLSAHPSLPPQEINRYLGGLIQLAMKGSFKSPAERRQVCLTVGLDALRNGVPEAAERWWREFIEACPAEDPRRARMAALLFTELGSWMAQPDDLDPYSEPAEALRDQPGAIRLLKQSLEHDPGHLPAYLELEQIYHYAGQTRERERLLDAMCQRFPEERAVLLRAGGAKLDRGEFEEGLALLQRAHARDQLDPATLRQLVRGHLMLGHWQYETGDLARARETFQRIEAYAVRDAIDLDRGLDIIRARQAAMEMVFGEETVGRERLATARAVTRAPVLTLLAAHIAYRAIGSTPPREGPFWQALQMERAGTPAERALLLRLLDYGHALKGTLSWKAEESFVRDALAPVAGPAFSRDEALMLCMELKCRSGWDKLAKDLVKAGLRHDRTDPRFLLLKELSIARRNGWIDFPKIARLRDEAARRGDQEAVTIATEFLDRSPPLPPGFDPMEEGDDSFYDDAGPGGAYYDPADDLYGLAAQYGFSPDQYDDFKRVATQMNTRGFRKFREKCTRDIPPPVFEMLFGMYDPSSR